jgi:hypothetical protein
MQSCLPQLAIYRQTGLQHVIRASTMPLTLQHIVKPWLGTATNMNTRNQLAYTVAGTRYPFRLDTKCGKTFRQSRAMMAKGPQPSITSNKTSFQK